MVHVSFLIFFDLYICPHIIKFLKRKTFVPLYWCILLKCSLVRIMNLEKLYSPFLCSVFRCHLCTVQMLDLDLQTSSTKFHYYRSDFHLVTQEATITWHLPCLKLPVLKECHCWRREIKDLQRWRCNHQQHVHKSVHDKWCSLTNFLWLD